MKFVITLGDAVELAFVALVVGALVIVYAVGFVKERRRRRLTSPAEIGQSKGESNGEV